MIINKTVKGGGIDEVTTVEDLESKLLSSNEGKVYHYAGETSGDYVKNNFYEVKVFDGYVYFVYYDKLPVYTIDVTTDGVESDPDNVLVIRPDGSVTLTFTADGELVMPHYAPTVTGADSVYIRVSDTEATITLTNPTADVDVEVAGVEHKRDGLYDENDQLIVTYEDSGMDVTVDFTSSTYTTDSRSGYCTMERYPNTRTIILPSVITEIGARSFRGCANLTSITIPNSVTSIVDGAFVGCSNLTSITIPNSVTSIGNSAFASCSSLTSITIPDSVTSIDNAAFQSCSSLTSITIPNGVTRIGSQTFQGCSNLTSITIPNGVTSIDFLAFSGCSNLTSATVEGTPTYISSSAFLTNSLRDIYVPWSKGAVADAPWGASNATIHYNWAPTT